MHLTTHKAKITLQSIPSNPTNTSILQAKGQYNLLDHLKKTPAQISIFELLHLSLEHKAILDKVLLESSLPTDLNVNQF